jgi:hypothetical protein
MEWRAWRPTCTMRTNRRQCLGLMWVVKDPDDSIDAYCPECGRDEVLIHSWQDTLWADGPMEPVPFEPPRDLLPASRRSASAGGNPRSDRCQSRPPGSFVGPVPAVP